MSATDPRIADWARQILTAIDDTIAEGALPATARSFTDLHDHCDANDFLTDADVPYDGTDTTIELIAAVQDAVTTLLQAPTGPRARTAPAATPGHDHTTTRADDGSDLDGSDLDVNVDTPVPMHCTDCGQPRPLRQPTRRLP